MTALLKFQFDVIGSSRDEVAEKLDRLVAAIITSEGGEPWIIISDKIEKQITDQAALTANDPNGWVYYGSQIALFNGPTVHGQGKPFHDGFRPQADTPENPVF